MVKANGRVLPQHWADPAFAEKPFDGIADLLYDLSRTSNVVLGIATGHTSSAVRPALDALGWRNFFRTVQAADMAPSKPHPGMLLQAIQATGSRISLLLALEVAPTGRATADRDGAARLDPADERRKSALGRVLSAASDAIRPDNQRRTAIVRTPHGRLSSRFRGWSGYPSIAAVPINPGNGAMGQKQILKL